MAEMYVGSDGDDDGAFERRGADGSNLFPISRRTGQEFSHKSCAWRAAKWCGPSEVEIDKGRADTMDLGGGRKSPLMVQFAECWTMSRITHGGHLLANSYNIYGRPYRHSHHNSPGTVVEKIQVKYRSITSSKSSMRQRAMRMAAETGQSSHKPQAGVVILGASTYPYFPPARNLDNEFLRVRPQPFAA